MKKIVSLFVVQVFLLSSLFSSLLFSNQIKSNYSDKIIQSKSNIEAGQNLAVGNFIGRNELDFSQKSIITDTKLLNIKINNSENVEIEDFSIKNDDDLNSLYEKKLRLRLEKIQGKSYSVSIDKDDNQIIILFTEREKSNEEQKNVKIIISKGKKEITIKTEANNRVLGLYFRNIIGKFLGSLEGYLANSVTMDKASKIQYPAPEIVKPAEVWVDEDKIKKAKKAGEKQFTDWAEDESLQKDENGVKIAPLGFMLLNGGLGTRMKQSLPKGHIDILKDFCGNKNMSMIEFHIRMIKAMEKKYNLRFHICIMNSSTTDYENLDMLDEKGLLKPDFVHLYSQGLAEREDEKGNPLAQSVYGDNAFNPPGHMDAVISVILTGMYEDLKEYGVEMLDQSNIHHVVSEQFTPILLGQKVLDDADLEIEKYETYVQFAQLSPGKVGGGLFELTSDYKGSDLINKTSGEQLMLEDSMLKDEYKELYEKKSKNKLGGFNTAHYLYQVDKVLEKFGVKEIFDKGGKLNYTEIEANIKKAVSMLPGIKPKKNKKFVVNGHRKEVEFFQNERQVQDAITFAMRTKYILSPENYVCEIKETPHIKKMARNFLLSLLPYLTSKMGFKENEINIIKSELKNAKEINKQLEAAYNLITRIILGAENKKSAVVLDFNVLEQMLNDDKKSLFLFLLPMIKRIVSQAGYDFNFIIKCGISLKEGENIEKQKIARRSYEKILKQAGIGGLLNIIYEKDERIKRLTKDAMILNIEKEKDLNLSSIYSNFKNSINKAEVYIGKNGKAEVIKKKVTDVYKEALGDLEKKIKNLDKEFNKTKIEIKVDDKLEIKNSLTVPLNELKEKINKKIVVSIEHLEAQGDKYNKAKKKFKEYFEKIKKDNNINVFIKVLLREKLGTDWIAGDVIINDGLKIEIKNNVLGVDGFISLRGSDTEPKFRVYANVYGDINNKSINEKLINGILADTKSFFTEVLVPNVLGKSDKDNMDDEELLSATYDSIKLDEYFANKIKLKQDKIDGFEELKDDLGITGTVFLLFLKDNVKKIKEGVKIVNNVIEEFKKSDYSVTQNRVELICSTVLGQEFIKKYS